jgi:protein O-GlcNAc transferase
MQNNSEELFQKALGFYKLKNFEKAYEICKQISESDADFSDAYHLAGIMLQQDGKHAEAQKFLERAVQIFPGNPSYINSLAKNLIALENYEKASFWLDRAEMHFPEYIELISTKAKFYSKTGNSLKAIEYYKKVIAKKPVHLSALNNLSNLLFKEGKKEEAEAYNKKVLEIQPQQQEALMNSGNFKRIAGDYQLAENLFISSY